MFYKIEVLNFLFHPNNKFMSQKFFPVLLLLCFPMFISDQLVAQEANNDVIASELFGGMKFRFAGPTRGGRSTAIEGIVQHPYTFYMGATGGGVWKTDDAGNTWKNVSERYLELYQEIIESH